MEQNLFNKPIQQTLHSFEETGQFSLIYKHKNGSLYQGDSIEWLKSLQSESVSLIFADPPYNINKADWDKFESQERYIEWSMQWVRHQDY